MNECDFLLNVFRCRGGFLVCPDSTLLPEGALVEHGDVSPLLGTY